MGEGEACFGCGSAVSDVEKYKRLVCWQGMGREGFFLHPEQKVLREKLTIYHHNETLAIYHCDDSRKIKAKNV